MKLAIVGLGPFGKSLAKRLGRTGLEVTAVDPDLERVDDVKNEVTLAVRLDPSDEEDLRSQGLGGADVLIAALDNFEMNQLVVVLSKRLGVKRVVALASSPVHARILRLIGADEVILPYEEAVDRLFMRLLQPALRSYVELTPGYTIAEVEPPKSFTGKPLGELKIRSRFGVSVIAILRKGYKRHAPKPGLINPVPGPEDVVNEGDVLMLAGPDANVQKMVNEL